MGRLHSPLLDGGTDRDGGTESGGGDSEIKSSPAGYGKMIKVTINLILLIAAVLVSWRWGCSLSWPTTTGYVSRSYIGAPSKGESFPIYATYSFSVADVPYTGTSRVGVATDQIDADEMQKQFVGTQVSVHYNPASPSENVTERGEGWLGVLALWLVFFGSLLPLYALPIYQTRGVDHIEDTLPLLIRSRGSLSDAVQSEVEPEQAPLPRRDRFDYLDRLHA